MHKNEANIEQLTAQYKKQNQAILKLRNIQERETDFDRFKDYIKAQVALELENTYTQPTEKHKPKSKKRKHSPENSDSASSDHSDTEQDSDESEDETPKTNQRHKRSTSSDDTRTPLITEEEIDPGLLKRIKDLIKTKLNLKLGKSEGKDCEKKVFTNACARIAMHVQSRRFKIVVGKSELRKLKPTLGDLPAGHIAEALCNMWPQPEKTTKTHRKRK